MPTGPPPAINTGTDFIGYRTAENRDQSILMLAWRITFNHLSVSALMWSVSSSEVLTVGSNPIVAIRS
jgi:hypothetical protein